MENIEIQRTPIPTALSLQPLILGIEPELSMGLIGLFGLVGFLATDNVWNIIPLLLFGPALFIILRAQTAKDPFFFRVFKQSIQLPRYLPAANGLLAPPDKVFEIN